MLASTFNRAASEWLIVRSHRPNVLITGTDDLIDTIVSELRPHLHRPVCEWSSGRSFPVTTESPTLIIRQVGSLSFSEQRHLLAWLEQHDGPRIQVVSTSCVEPFRLVHDGAFLACLYYRLNVVRMDALTLAAAPDAFLSTM